MRVHFVTCILAIAPIISPGGSYRILGMFTYNGRSHFMMDQQLLIGLAKSGHQVDVVSHFPLKTPVPNYNQIINLAGTIPAMQGNVTYEFIKQHLNVTLVSTIAITYGSNLCDIMGQPRVRQLIETPPKNPPYDLVIANIFGATCYLALGQHLKVPVVATVASAMWPWVNDMVANPDNPAYIPSVLSGLHGRMNFWERLSNTLELTKAKWEFDHYSAGQDEKIKKYIGPHAPSLRDAERNVSLILVNSHYSLHGVRPFTAAVVEIGGLHISDTAESLPKDLEKWLNDSEDGFVYISFGAMTKIESFPRTTLLALYNSIEKLSPVRVLMRIANPKELPPGLPDNVLTRPWIPQLAVLKHKHVRLFMTHGGSMGTQEAIYCGVPMIGVPLFADQRLNIELYARKHVAVLLHHDDLTENKFDAAFNTVLNDPSYTKAAKKLSVEFRDRPMTAMDTAVFWIEYVVRHGGASLRSPAMDLTWWQIALLDVYGVLLFAVVLVLYLLKLVILTVIAVSRKKTVERLVYSKKVE